MNKTVCSNCSSKYKSRKPLNEGAEDRCQEDGCGNEANYLVKEADRVR